MTDADMTCHEPLLLSHMGMAVPTAVCSLYHFLSRALGYICPRSPMSLSRPSILSKPEEGTIRDLPRSVLPKCTVRMYSFFTVNAFPCLCLFPPKYCIHSVKQGGESKKSMTRAFQINSLSFEQGSGWGRVWDGSSLTRVTGGQSSCYIIWSTS